MRYSKIIIMSIVVFVFIGCGGGGGSSSQSNESVVEETESSNINIEVLCQSEPTASDIEGYITLQSGDEIQKNTEDTQVKIYSDVNGNSKVCLVQGEASIIRS